MLNKISVSAISTSTSNFFQNLELFQSESVGAIHVDVMDGHFVPRLGIHPELIEEIRSQTNLSIDVHLMVDNPFDHIGLLSKTGANRVITHVESTPHNYRLLQEVLNVGMGAGIAINPGTPLQNISDLLSITESILVMGINPGIKGHSLIPSTFSRVQKLKSLVEELGFKGTLEVDGGVTFENLQKLIDSGATRVVCGAGTIFHPSESIASNIQTIKSILA